ncbi:hypothetical protein NDU88_002855 [Pleurodeles waltl]|uniref:Uncharacterized protein n=1 Tax=Pleurodeles waltl TaxID=8319 RepID=A0AAV7RBI2_PLEWA|nr:hypothetical protein NDU88_002855 [Pleurodeles waltl]
MVESFPEESLPCGFAFGFASCHFQFRPVCTSRGAGFKGCAGLISGMRPFSVVRWSWRPLQAKDAPAFSTPVASQSGEKRMCI